MGTAITILILTIMKKINDYINIGNNNDDKIKNNMNGNTIDNNDKNIVKKKQLQVAQVPTTEYALNKHIDRLYRNIKNCKTDNPIY